MSKLLSFYPNEAPREPWPLQKGKVVKGDVLTKGSSPSAQLLLAVTQKVATMFGEKISWVCHSEATSESSDHGMEELPSSFLVRDLVIPALSSKILIRRCSRSWKNRLSRTSSCRESKEREKF